MPWSPEVQVPDQLSKAQPALATFAGQLHMVHLGDSSNAIWHSVFDGSGWSENVKIPGQLSKAPPALAVFGRELHMVHLGDSSNAIWHSVFDGSGWSENVKIPGQLSKAPPALAVFGRELHMVHLGDSSNAIWHSVFDGSGWSENVKIPGQLSKAPPALAVFGRELHMVHLGDSSNAIWHSVFDGSGWSENVKIPGQLSKAPPALAVFGRELHMVHLGDSSNAIWHSVFVGSNWSDNVKIPGQLSKAAPALGQFQGRLHMVHLGDSSNRIWWSVFDGASWSDDKALDNRLSKASPALTAFVDSCGVERLHMLHLGNVSNRIWQSEFSQSDWGRDRFVVGQLSKAAVGLAVFDARLHMGHLGDTTNRIWHSSYDGLDFEVRISPRILEEPERFSREHMLQNMTSVYAGVGFRVRVVNQLNLDLPSLEIVDVGGCIGGTTTPEQADLYSHRGSVAGPDVTAVFFIEATVPSFNGCAAHLPNVPNCIVTEIASAWTLGHEIGHVLGLDHTTDSDNLMYGDGTDDITDAPPELDQQQVQTMQGSPFVRRCRLTLDLVREVLKPDEPDYPRLAAALGPPALEYLEELIAHEQAGPAAKAASLAAAIGGPEAAGALEAAAAHAAAGVRAVAAYGAPQLPLDTARPLLEALLDDPHPAVVKRAVVASGELEAGEVLTRKIERIAETHPDAGVRRAAGG